MVCVTHVVVSLFILVPLLGVSAFSANRDPKVSLSSSTEHPDGVSLKIQNTAQPPQTHVTFEPSRSVSIVKREVSLDEDKVNDMYDPSLVTISKKSAAALNKLMTFALRNSIDESGTNSFENEVESPRKDTRIKIAGFRTGGGNMEPFNLVQRSGQKDRKVYYRCYFNAVSCF